MSHAPFHRPEATRHSIDDDKFTKISLPIWNDRIYFVFSVIIMATIVFFATKITFLFCQEIICIQRLWLMLMYTVWLIAC